MNIAKYCKEKGMNINQYNTFCNNIKATAQAIKDNSTYTHGMYYPINDIISFSSDSIMKGFIIQELKQLGFEFIEDYTLYRV